MKRTKISLILEALENGEKLTHLKALAYNTHRLAVFIHTLRKRGYNIVTTTKTDANGFDFAEYHIPQAT